ncbi:cobalt ABC transporter ATP-binding protein [Gardnerella swidsinskii]|uniref:Cobalt ABC transporter ATP-binding protein n=1 Tax=Gardnerella swidsinskii TaxID=2792979 RepID=A0A9X7FEM7_9BIFI|nr:energy-coupling factor transporter ATPase [Gardnerella swidsinskii]NSX40984.1 ATP-binding cassette domain-containing protein [Gardnerella vaginalis]PMC54718.1 cobalt ABC transporter ATP-binding protein [Gardnerella swidsinskii]
MNEAKKHMIENNAQVVLRNICFSYDDGKTWTLNNLSLTINPGERVAIVGLNGSGKSTLAKIIAGLTAPDSGYVTLCGEKVFENTTACAESYKNARKYIGALFQSPEDQIITTITEEDVAFGLENLQFPQKAMYERISEALKTVHMEDKRYADPSTMSGGQQQRVALASAIAMNSKLLVLDEPTSMLDSFARKDVDALFDNLHKNGTTIVQITHNFEECKRANRILLLENGNLKEISFNGLKTYFSNIELANNHVTKISDNKNLTDSRFKENKSDIAVEISGLTVQYDKTSPAVIDDYSLTVKSGETVAIMGENGCGKSTLAKTMCGLLKANSGNITVHGISVKGKTSRIIRQKLHQTIGYVMQLPEQQLFADTVRNDVAYGPKNFGLKDSALKERVDETLRLLNLENLAEKSPFALSGGQQRLVAIAGVLACKPRVLVLDEPTAGLDFEAALRIRKILGMLHNQGVTIILITHNLQEAENLGARLVTLKTRNKASNKECSTAKNIENTKNKESSTKAKTTSLLKSFDPRATLLSCFILMLSAFSITNYIQLAILAFVTFTLTVAAKIPFVKLIASLHMIIAIFVFSGLLNILAVRTGTVLANIATIPITTDGINYAILFATRFSLVIIIGAVLVLTMSQTTLNESCTRLLSPLRHIGIPTQEIALIMSLALRFLPTLSAEAHSVALAQIARGSSIRDGSFKQRVHAITALIVPGFAGVIRHADILAFALDARCYAPGAERTHLHSWKMHIKDVLLLVVTLCVVSAIIVCKMLPL